MEAINNNKSSCQDIYQAALFELQKLQSEMEFERVIGKRGKFGARRQHLLLAGVCC